MTPDDEMELCRELLGQKDTVVIIESSVAYPLAQRFHDARCESSIPMDLLDALTEYVLSPGAKGKVHVTKTVREQITRLGRKNKFKGGSSKLLDVMNVLRYANNPENRSVLERIYDSEVDTPTVEWARQKAGAVDGEFGPGTVDKIADRAALRNKVRWFLRGGVSDDMDIIAEAMSLAGRYNVILVTYDGDFFAPKKALYREIESMRGAGTRSMLIMSPRTFVGSMGRRRG